MPEFKIKIKEPNQPKQKAFIEDAFKRKMVRAGRRGGKTEGSAILAAKKFLNHGRVLYGTPTQDQVGAFWREILRIFAHPINAGIIYKNETQHYIEIPGTEQRIRAKTAWNADTLRGDYADTIILDEFQLMNEDALDVVVMPMLLDNNGDLILIYTPPSLHSRSTTKANDPRHAAKKWKEIENDPRWGKYHWRSDDNPAISREALAEITKDMSRLAYQQEIEAIDLDHVPGALWDLEDIDRNRIKPEDCPDLTRLGIGVDPPGGRTECGIVAAGVAPCNCRGETELHMFVVEDRSLKATPDKWGKEVDDCYTDRNCDFVAGEQNYGGDMVENTIMTVNPVINYEMVTATRGKAVRAEPVVALYEQGKVHHVGVFKSLEDEMCSWIPDSRMPSPNRMDALVWIATRLMIKTGLTSWRPVEDEEQKPAVMKSGGNGRGMTIHRAPEPVYEEAEDNFVPIQSWRPIF